MRYGYDVQVFAPGEAYSGTINPLDFMRDAQDAVMAAEIGQVIARNASPVESKGNEFFEKAGELMAKGLVQLAKSSPYPDLAFVYAIIQLPDLVKRIDHAVHRPDGHPLKMDSKQWVWLALDVQTREISEFTSATVAQNQHKRCGSHCPRCTACSAVIYSDFWSTYAEVLPSKRSESSGQRNRKNYLY